MDFIKPFAVKIGERPIQIDIFNAISGVSYDDAVKNAISYTYSGSLSVRFLHFNDLIVNKMLSGRLKDKADVEELQRINKYTKDK